MVIRLSIDSEKQHCLSSEDKSINGLFNENDNSSESRLGNSRMSTISLPIQFPSHGTLKRVNRVAPELACRPSNSLSSLEKLEEEIATYGTEAHCMDGLFIFSRSEQIECLDKPGWKL